MENELDDYFEAKITERNERAKKLYRYVSDVARRVGDATATSNSIADLFTTQMEIQRQKLRDNCEKLMFLDPINYGKKSLELIWRKIYYEPVSAAKKLRETDTDYDSYLFTHIVCGVGHFHHLITRTQTEMKLQFKELDYMTMHDEDAGDDSKKPELDQIQFGKSALHLCLIYLGDLSRYQAEIFHTFEPSIAARYYLQAAQLDMTSGMPYNQLGNLYMDINYNLDSVCYYIHCLTCDTPFDGALGNLTKIFQKNSQFDETLQNFESLTQTEHIQRMVANFFSLIEIWYLNKNDTNIPNRCSTIAQEFKIAIDFNQAPLPDINKNFDDYNQAIEEENTNPTYLNSNLIHKMVLICLFTIIKVAEIDEIKVFAVKAFTLAMLSQLLQKLLETLEHLGLKNPAVKLHPRKVSLKTEKIIETIEIEIVKDEQNDQEEPKVNGKHDSEDDLADEKIATDNTIKENGNTKASSKKVLAKRRRRRRATSVENSDVSDDEETESDDDETKQDDCSEDDDDDESEYYSDDDSKSECSIDDSDLEELKEKTNGDVSDHEVININNKINAEPETIETEKTHDTPEENKWNEQGIQNFLAGNNFLASIKLLQDWVLLEKDLILSCGDSGESMFQCVVDLLNIFTFYFSSNNKELMEHESKILDYSTKVAKSLQLEFKTIPLPEDINLRGTNICKFDKDAAEWQILDKYNPTVYDENIIRILDFIDFGNQIAKIVPQIRYNRTLKIFYLKKSSPPKPGSKINHKKTREWHNSKKPHGEGGQGGLLRRLGRLWLVSRVRELEKSAGGAAWGGGGGGAPAGAPAFLVLDAAALHRRLRRVKQLLRSKDYILLIPNAVLQELDELKREQSGARDAIRWLELQLRAGSRLVRPQRPGQARPLPRLTLPRHPPPRLAAAVHVLEFCYHFLADEAPGAAGAPGGDGDAHGKPAPLLVLLTGAQPGEERFKEFSVAGAAAAAGISLQHIDEFYARWRLAHRAACNR